jgi:hypothetical protein
MREVLDVLAGVNGTAGLSGDVFSLICLGTGCEESSMTCHSER